MRKTNLAVAGVLAAMCGSAHAGDVFALDVRLDDFMRFPINDPGSRQVLNTGTVIDGYAIDFDQTATTLYAIDNLTRDLGTINLTDGSWNPLVSTTGLPADTITGLAIGPNGEAFVSTALNLFSFDLTTGAATLIGPFGTTLMIEIAIDANGDMFGHDIGTDSFYTIDTTTGAATLIGSHGLAANFAQGMDFDWETNTLYATIYTGGGTGQFVSVDTTTGAVTMLFDTFPWNSEMEMAIQSPATTNDCPADFDNSGTLTLADFVAFRNAYTSGDMAADFDNSGTLTLADFVAFRNAYTAGCP